MAGLPCPARVTIAMSPSASGSFAWVGLPCSTTTKCAKTCHLTCAAPSAPGPAGSSPSATAFTRVVLFGMHPSSGSPHLSRLGGLVGVRALVGALLGVELDGAVVGRVRGVVPVLAGM